jgi:hypothetical protein
MLPVVVAVVHGKHGVGIDAAKNNVDVFPQNIRGGLPILPMKHGGIGMIG